MSWAIQTRVSYRHDRGVLVLVSWLALGSIDDVAMYGGPGVRLRGESAPTRREMNAFSPPIAGTFDLDAGVADPEIVLEWTDGGELCRETLAIPTPHEHFARAMADRVARPRVHGGLGTVLRKRPALPFRRHR